MRGDKIKYLFDRTKETISEEGIAVFGHKSFNYIKIKANKNKKQEYKDILYINGCMLPHPKRYRVDHQIEQLESFDMSADYIDFDKLSLDLIKYYRGFVFYRCPYTAVIGEFIDCAKKFNKRVIYDVDDLVIDTKYTDKIPYLNALPKTELDLYNDGVNRMKKTLKLCDYAITTTERLAEELSNYVPEVYINRNVASERMVEMSQKAESKIVRDSSKIILGYFSGSITHNDDFNLILPAITQIMLENENVYLKVAGILDIPKELEGFSQRILSSPFVEWQLLPNIIASVDINLAPIVDSIFNEAKSENKWIEASLCRVVTIASKVGAFEYAIKDGKTGVLCNNTTNDWYEKLTLLITDEGYRKKIARNAFDIVSNNNVTSYSGQGLSDFLEAKLAQNVAFILPSTNISGGVNVILKHCLILRKYGIDAFVINNDKSDDTVYHDNEEILVLSPRQSKLIGRIDTMVGTLWSTLQGALEYPRVRNVNYLVQGFETDFMKRGQYARVLANATYNTYKPIKYTTISKWCESWLNKRYKKNVYYAPNGLNIELFPYKERLFEGKIKILIEGNSTDYYKNVDESFRIVEKLDKNKYEITYLSYAGEAKKWYHVDKFLHKVPHHEVGKIYQDADILIKSSLLESFSYPPLEMMATGGLVVAAPNGGNVEFLTNEYNCMLYEQGNVDDAILQIEKIVSDSDLRNKLVENGLSTAKSRSWDKIEKDILNLYKRNGDIV